MRQDQVFTNASVLPGAQLEFEHVVSGGPEGSVVTVTVRLSGALAQIWKRLMGAGMRDAARSSVEGLLASLDRTIA
jgi:hypothetical protein